MFVILCCDILNEKYHMQLNIQMVNPSTEDKFFEEYIISVHSHVFLNDIIIGKKLKQNFEWFRGIKCGGYSKFGGKRVL